MTNRHASSQTLPLGNAETVSQIFHFLEPINTPAGFVWLPDQVETTNAALSWQSKNFLKLCTGSITLTWLPVNLAPGRDMTSWSCGEPWSHEQVNMPCKIVILFTERNFSHSREKPTNMPVASFTAAAGFTIPEVLVHAPAGYKLNGRVITMFSGMAPVAATLELTTTR